MRAASFSIQDLKAHGMTIPDHSINDLLARRDEPAFEQVFKTHFKNLHAYACSILGDEDDAEETVQQVFFKLWDRADQLNLAGSIAAYLYRAVHNESLNNIKHKKVKSEHQLYVAHSIRNQSVAIQQKITTKELESKFQDALNTLPEQCRTIFQLSRFDNLKYREIADKLGISVKTVESQMGKALRILRSKLVDFLPLLFILLTC